jgi:hypothetical protein
VGPRPAGRAGVAFAFACSVSLACVASLALGTSALAARPALGAKRVCHARRARAAACTALRLQHVSSARVQTSPIPGYLTPQLLHAAYALPTSTQYSSGQTIAVIDAYDDPTAEADLQVYDRQFGLPECTSANGCFRKINAEGKSSPLPEKNGEWASEISIDVQMAHAVCQGCRVLLVEARSEEFSALGAAVNAAVKAGATEISNSYGGPEEPSVASFYSELNADYYQHPGVVVTASSGDCGYLNEACRGRSVAANFPASSPDVLAVGGTALTEKKGVWTSAVWDDGGSGCSGIFAAPAWQSALAGFSATGCGGDRSVADVAAIGDPNTGVDVYDSTPEGDEATGWGVWGGTSVASPILAGEFGLAGGAHGVSYPAATLYSHLGESGSLYDVVSGANGSCDGKTSCEAAVGYDGPSGVGSPIGLGAFSSAGSPTATSLPSISGIAEQGQTLTVKPGLWSPSPTVSELQWLRCSASGSGCSAIAGATGSSYALSAADVGSSIRVQEMDGDADGPGVPAVSTASATVAADVTTLGGFTPSAGITGSTVTISGTALGSVSEVEFDGLSASFKALSSQAIEAIVPDGASNGKITLVGAAGTITSKAKFEPTLSITSVTPASGAAGTLVTIKGVGFNTSSTASFGGVNATVKSVRARRLRVYVPAGAGSGPVVVTNTAAPSGTVASASSYSP